MGSGEGGSLSSFTLVHLCLYFIQHCLQGSSLAGRTKTLTALFLIGAFLATRPVSGTVKNDLTCVYCYGVVVHVTFEDDFSFGSAAAHCHWPVIQLFTCDILS